MHHAISWHKSHFTFSRLAADLCLISHHYIMLTEVEEQQPWSSQKITALGGTDVWWVWSLWRRNKEGHQGACASGVHWNNRDPKQLDSCSRVRSVRSFREASHTPAANFVSLVTFPSKHHSQPYAECLSSGCPETGTAMKHKSRGTKRLTFCSVTFCNQSAQEKHINTHMRAQKQW